MLLSAIMMFLMATMQVLKSPRTLGENFSLNGGYVNFKDMGASELAAETNIDNAIWYVGAEATFGDFALTGMYLKGDASTDNKRLEQSNRRFRR